MAIVGVQMPEYRDKLADLAKMMNIAQSVFGIMTDREVAKIRKEQAKQEAIKSRQMDMEERYREQGIITDKEKQESFPAEPGDPGSTWKYERQAAVDEEGNRIKNPDGTDKVNLVPYFFFPKGYVEGQKIKRESQKEELDLAENVAASKGLYTPRMLMNPQMVSTYSWEPKKGYRQATLTDKGVTKPVWLLTPSDIQAQNIEADNLRAGEMLKIDQAQAKNRKTNDELDISIKREKLKQLQTPAPTPGGSAIDIKHLNADQRMGYANAQANGIANPSATDINNYDPKQIDKQKLDLKNEIDAAKIPGLLNALNNVQTLVNIDDDKPIPNYGGARWAAGQTTTFGLGDKLLTPREIQLRNNINEIKSQIRLVRSGTAVSKPEAALLDSVMGTDLFSSSEALKMGMRNIRDATRGILRNIETPYYGKPSLIEWKKIPGSIHSDMPILQGSGQKTQTFPKKQYSPGTPIEQIIDDKLGR